MEAGGGPTKELHWSFVAMLFALAIGEVAVGLSNLINLNIQGHIRFRDGLPAYSHLLLAATVIAASWVGWRNSEYSGTHVQSVFSLDFIVLMVDVALVVCYFLLARVAESPQRPSYAIIPDASREAWIIAVIMLIYVVWDLLSSCNHRNKLGKRLWASVIPFVLSVVALWLFPLHSDDSRAVVFTDIALFGLVLLFRALKLHDWGCHTPLSKLAIGVSVFVFLAFLVLARSVA
ncbi:hypothetical protein [Anaerobaca lacustris]|uniref:Uncharacterized protein n=1 Tax=Anaerobaca lacustris TaxID=3044600 RepID=A0AAW6U3J1_9BACT|nr:hypothetical protein [Sedimentisphaerales bacterium M17dextr]